jgi:hypothetical protein
MIFFVPYFHFFHNDGNIARGTQNSLVGKEEVLAVLSLHGYQIILPYHTVSFGNFLKVITGRISSIQNVKEFIYTFDAFMPVNFGHSSFCFRSFYCVHVHKYIGDIISDRQEQICTMILCKFVIQIFE